MDWDETITTKDTTSLVAQTAYRRKSGLTDFSHYSKIYMDAYEKYKAEWPQKRSIEEEIEFQKGMKKVEMSLISAIEQDGLFKGLTKADFAESANEVDFKSGFEEFIKSPKLQAVPSYVLSVNWSKTLIETALQRLGVSGITVLANELEYDDAGRSTGYFQKDVDIRTGYDKLEELGRIKCKHPEGCVVYVGDSAGDVVPIVKADMGILIEGGKGRKLLESLGAPIHTSEPLEPGKVHEASWKDLLQQW